MLALVLGPQRRRNTALFSRSLKISVQLARCALFDPSIVGMSPDRSEIFDSQPRTDLSRELSLLRPGAR